MDATEVVLDGKETGGDQLIIRKTGIQLDIMVSLTGRTRGAFFGWTGVFFSLFSASLFAIIAALIGRIGFGKQLPFGSFLTMGAFAWMFGGRKLWQWYMEFVGFSDLPL